MEAPHTSARATGKLSVVVPVYKCADCLATLHERLTATLRTLDREYEVVFVDDRSPDGAWSAIAELASVDPLVSAIRLSRNFGQSAALTAGIARATGDWIVLMDCDLQDRPEDIPRLLEKAFEGNEIVFTRRSNRDQSTFRRLGADAYFRIRNYVLGVDLPRDLGSLFLLSRKVADAFLQIKDRDRQHGLILAWLGFENDSIAVPHDPRYSGKSSYTLRKLLAVALEGVFFQSTLLLRWIVYFGFSVAAAGLVFAVVVIAQYFTVDPLPGWTSIMVLVLILGGVTLVSIGVAALYIGRIFEQVKARPLYVVDEEIGGKANAAQGPAGKASACS
jgi:glycosyltransferase involved in cell wall biosynthesis